MKLAVIADVHVHNAKRQGGPVERSLNKRCRETLDVLERAYKRARSEGCTVMCVAGDLLDSTTPEPQLLGELLRIVREARRDLAVKTVLLVGNHDQQSDEEGDHALAPFVPFQEDADVIEATSVLDIFDDLDLVCLPHSAAAPATRRLRELTASLGPRRAHARRVLLMHAGVSDDKTAPFLKGSSDSVDIESLRKFMAAGDISVTLAGNWHDRRRWESPTVLQVGALVPTGWDNPGLEGYGGLAIVDSSDLSVREITLEGPRFVATHGLKALCDLLAHPQPTERRLYLRATVDPDEMGEAVRIIGDAHSQGRIASGEVIPDGKERAVEARKAASAARSADTLAGALDRFVSAMPLEDDVKREEVLEKCRVYLKST